MQKWAFYLYDIEPLGSTSEVGGGHFFCMVKLTSFNFNDRNLNKIKIMPKTCIGRRNETNKMQKNDKKIIFFLTERHNYCY